MRTYTPSAETRRKLAAGIALADLFNEEGHGITVRAYWGYTAAPIGYRSRGVCITVKGTGLDGEPCVRHALRPANGPGAASYVAAFLHGLAGREMPPPPQGAFRRSERERAEWAHRDGADLRGCFIPAPSAGGES